MDIQHLGMFFAKSNFQMWLGVQPVGLLCVVRRAGSWCGLKNLGLLWALWTLRHADCSSTTMVPWADFSYLIIRNAFCLWISLGFEISWQTAWPGGKASSAALLQFFSPLCRWETRFMGFYSMRISHETMLNGGTFCWLHKALRFASAIACMWCSCEL